MTNLMYQVFKGKTTFVICEYLFKQLQPATVEPLEDLGHHLARVAPHAFKLATVECSDKTVKDMAKLCARGRY